MLSIKLYGDFILLGAIGGIAQTDIADGKTGAVHISGVFSVAKASGTVNQGAKLYWNSTNDFKSYVSLVEELCRYKMVSSCTADEMELSSNDG